ncbi:diguanylate cyclase [Opitutaceae bacterium TAV5]|nr:diguanylate cyclase [Opitutaceae bacterium TAV5]
MNTPAPHTTTGIHHVTAIAGDPQTNVDFYTGLLGLRLVKKTVNFDDPSAWHLYYGDETGSPGSIVTFFFWPDLAVRGRVGAGQTTALVFSAPATALAWWQERLQAHRIAARRRTRFGEEVLAFADPDGIPVEIVAVDGDTRTGWSDRGSDIPPERALRGLHTAELTVRDARPTEKLLIGEMGYRLVRREGARARYESGSGGPGHYADVIDAPAAPAGAGGVGTIHHIAWRAPDDETELALQARLHAAGYQVSPVRDRQYFRSVYYREHGGILFEIATDVPGFAIDESIDSLGTTLRLPPQFEHAREAIRQALPPIEAARKKSVSPAAR